MATETKEKQQIKETTLKNTKLSTVKLDWKQVYQGCGSGKT
jgi:hypothetical protein